MENSSRSFGDLDGLKCNSNCQSTACIFFGSKSSCDLIEHRFKIITPDDPSAAKIKGGVKVALRSQTNPLHWLDCSNTAAGAACTITRCTLNNNLESSTSSSGITTCDNHFFKIFGVGARREGKLINNEHSIQLRHKDNTMSYFNCDAPPNGKCKLSDCGNNCQAQGYVFKFNIIE